MPPEDSPRRQYVLETLLSTIGVPYTLATPGEPWPAGSHVDLWVDRDGVEEIFRHLVRGEEHDTTRRDKYERFLWEHSGVDPREDAARPLVSLYGLDLLNTLRATAKEAGLPFVRKEPWPGGRPMAACLTHDVDAVSRGKLPRGVAVRDVRGILGGVTRGRLSEAAQTAASVARTVAGSNPYWSFDRISGLEREHGFRSTYFVMAGRLHPEDAHYDPAEPRMRNLMRSLVSTGCEIGLHGSFGTFADPPALRSQKEKLESVLGAEVTGHRNHVLRFRTPDSWRAHEAAGFSYDATLGFADHEGFRGCHAFPFRPYDLAWERSLDLLEMPLAVMDVSIHKYRRLRGDAAWAAIEAVVEETRDVGGLATLLWHNDTFYDPDYPGCGRLYERALEWLAGTGAWVATCAEVDRWWRAREEAVLRPLEGEKNGWVLEATREIEGLTLRVTLPDPAASVRVEGQVQSDLLRAGPDHVVILGRMESGARVDLLW